MEIKKVIKSKKPFVRLTLYVMTGLNTVTYVVSSGLYKTTDHYIGDNFDEALTVYDSINL